MRLIHLGAIFRPLSFRNDVQVCNLDYQYCDIRVATICNLHMKCLCNMDMTLCNMDMTLCSGR